MCLEVMDLLYNTLPFLLLAVMWSYLAFNKHFDSIRHVISIKLFS
jgi:hypothetical protein